MSNVVSEDRVFAIIEQNPHITRTEFKNKFRGEQRSQAYTLLDALVQAGRVNEGKDGNSHIYSVPVPLLTPNNPSGNQGDGDKEIPPKSLLNNKGKVGSLW